MKYIPLLFALLASCAMSEDQLRKKAKECVAAAYTVNDEGIVGDPTEKQRKDCWVAYNIRAERLFKIREKKRKARESEQRYINLCGPSKAPVFEVWSRTKKRFIGCMDLSRH